MLLYRPNICYCSHECECMCVCACLFSERNMQMVIEKLKRTFEISFTLFLFVFCNNLQWNASHAIGAHLSVRIQSMYESVLCILPFCWCSFALYTIRKTRKCFSGRTNRKRDGEQNYINVKMKWKHEHTKWKKQQNIETERNGKKIWTAKENELNERTRNYFQ